MFTISRKALLAPQIYLMDIEAPRLAKSAKPGQFLIVKIDERGERIPLTICDFDKEKGTISIVFQVVGKSTQKMALLDEGDAFADVVGPLGQESEFLHEDIEKLKTEKTLFIGGGVGTAPVYPQVKWMHQQGISVDVIIGTKTHETLIFEGQMRSVSGNYYVATDDGSFGFKGLVTDVLKHLIEVEKKQYTKVIAIGPMVMMKFVALQTQAYNIPTIVSLNTLMVDGTGMCGACRVSVGGKMKFTCVDGPEFDGHLVDFNEAMRRQQMYVKHEIATDTPDHSCNLTAKVERRKTKVPVREQAPEQRVQNFEEVCLGYNAEEAMEEAERCIECKKPGCVQGCPVSIKIPDFIREIKKGNFEQAARFIAEDSALPSVCGRVCPQESQCEEKCVLGIKGDPVSIGKLERFVGDWTRENKISLGSQASKNNCRIAVVGSGPAGLTCAGDLAKKGYDVTIFEALHQSGGVLVYGIPEFRLPKEVVEYEIQNITSLGVKIETNVIVGKTLTVDDLLKKEGFQAVFIGSGAGLPKFMKIPGENLNGVLSANELLTRSNLMKAYKEGYSTPVYTGTKVAVVGGGNVAMDAARTAKRLGADVHVVYRRSEKELPARVEEVHHAKEEGIHFHLLTNPTEILGDEKGWVKGIRCIRMELGEPDESGRRSPVEIPNSEYDIDVDCVVMSLGTSPNPLIASTTSGLETTRWGGIIAEEPTGQTTKQAVFAGGDAVTGAATVILAMGAGKSAAQAIDEYIKTR